MAAGYIDEQGVYIFGESDEGSPFSKLLNKGQAEQSRQFADVRSKIAQLASYRPVRIFNSDSSRDDALGQPVTEAQRRALQDASVTVVRSDKGGAMERYFATWNASSNPTGRATPGWYAIGVGAWENWDPKFGSFDPGTGAVKGRVRRVGNWIEAWFSVVLGTGFVVGGNPEVILPVVAAIPPIRFAEYGRGTAVTTGASPSVRSVHINAVEVDPTRARMYTGEFSPISSGAPWSWASGHSIYGHFSYEAAS